MKCHSDLVDTLAVPVYACKSPCFFSLTNGIVSRLSSFVGSEGFFCWQDGLISLAQPYPAYSSLRTTL